MFDFGNYPLARKAFDSIYTIFDIQDDYGRGISIHDLEKIDLDEIRAKYLHSIYLTEKPSTRVAHLLKAMIELSQLDSYSSQPKLEDLINISVTSHKLMQNAAESIRTYSKRMKDYAEGKQWPRDRIESPAHPDSGGSSPPQTTGKKFLIQPQ